MKKSASFSLILIAFLISVMSFSQKESTAPHQVPFDSNKQLKSLINLNYEYADSSNMVIVYTYLECKPCLALAKKLNKSLITESINPSSLVYVNVFNSDTSRINKFLEKHQYKSPYYAFKYPIDMIGAYPKIAAYDKDGNLAWEKEGYSKEVLEAVMKHIGDL